MLRHVVVPGLRRCVGWVWLALVPGVFAQGSDVLLNWDRSSDPDTRGYQLSLRQADGSYGEPIDLGTRTAHYLVGLGAGTHFFRVTTSTLRGAAGNYVRDFAISTEAPLKRGAATVAWDAGPSGIVAGYTIHVGASPGSYGTLFDVGRATTYSLAALSPGTYFFAIQAYGYQGESSPLSNELSATIFSGEPVPECPAAQSGCGPCSSIRDLESDSPHQDLCYPYKNPAGSSGARLIVTNIGSAATPIAWMSMEGISSSDFSGARVHDLEAGEQFAVPGEFADRGFASGWVRLTSLSSRIIGSLSVFDSASPILGTVDAAPEPPGAFVFPQVGVWGSSRLSIGNSGIAATTLTLQLRDRAGAIKDQTTREIVANGVLEIGSLQDLFPGSPEVEESDYLRGFSTAPVSVFKFEERNGKTVYAFRGLPESEAGTTLLCPQFVVGAGWISQVSAVNVDPEPADVSVEFVGEDGSRIGSARSIRIEPNGKLQFAGGDLFGLSSGQFQQGYLVLRSSGARIAGSITFMDDAGQRFAASLPLTSRPERAHIINQLASSREYFTGISILNPGDKDTTVKLELYDAGKLDEVTVVGIGARRRQAGLLTEFFPTLVGTTNISGYLRICSDQPVASHALLGAHDLSFLSAIPSQPIQ